MAFLEKVTEVGAKGLSKAKDLGETAAYKTKIALAEGKIDDVYEEMGKALYEAGGVMDEQVFGDFVCRIKGFETEIEELKAKIAEIKG